MDKLPLKIAISAGELSGDEHGAELVRAIRQACPDARVAGMGGRHLREAGVELVVDAEKEASVMGVKEVVPAIGRIFRAFATLRDYIKESGTDVLVLVDYPDFNLRLARAAKKSGTRVFYYITPQLWAWRKGRVRQFRKYVDRAACIFPFERPFFEKLGYPKSVYVGHPFASRYFGLHAPSAEQKDELKRSFGLDPSRPVLCIFPGSRNHEISLHIDVVSDVWNALRAKHPGVQGIISIASTVDRKVMEERFGKDPDLHILSEDPLKIMQASDAGLIKSGTSNLQAVYCELPFAMFFRTSPFSAMVAKLFLKIDEFSIANVIKSGTVREFVQEKAQAGDILAELEALLFDVAVRAERKAALANVRQMLNNTDSLALFEGCTTAAQRAARLVLEERKS